MTRASFILRILFATFCLFNYCSCGSENILKSYEEYYNRENSNFTYEDGILYNLERVDTSKYKIEITIKVKEQANPKSFRLLKCSATLLDNAGTLTVDENQCEDGTSGSRSTNEAADVSSELENSQDETTELSELATTESDDARQAVNLDSEVQSDNAQINSSEEQFVAIPRPQPSSTPCIGCSSLVDNNAPGVEALANLAVRHINKHTPDSAYKLKSILQVERQVQVVNGVRYLLTIVISDSSCVETQANDCPGIKTCKISILEKPWLKISNGKKFRAVLSNNCTEQWLYGDEGEELLTKDDDVTNADDEVIKVIKNIDVQATPNSERKLTEEELKELEEQIIPTNEIGRQKRNAYVDTGVEVVLEPKSLYLQDLAIEAFEKYSLKKDLRFRVVYATRLLGVHGETTRIDFNVRLQPTVEDETNEDNMRCHSRISENDVNIKSFYTYCIHIDNGLNGAIEMPASNPTFRPVALEKLRSEYGNLLKFDEVIRVYVDAGKQNIIFDAKSSANDVYRCYFIIHENVNMPLVCKLQEPENSPVHKIEKDPTATKYLHLSMVTLKKYLIYSNITEPYIIAAVTHASESNGPLTNIDIDFIAVAKNATLRCISQIEENKESNISSIVVNCSTIPERKDYPAGVIIERNPFDENYIKIAMEALKKNYSHLNYRDLRVVYANEQLLDTLITRIDFEINLKNSTGFRCHVKLLQKLSEKMEDEYVDCFPKSEINLGGRIDHNASDPENWKSAEESLIRKYNNTLVLLEVVRFTTQVVEGVASETDFYAISPLDKIVHHCHSQKLHQPWHNVSEINVECKPKNATPIPTTGEIVEQDPSDPKYKAVALEALSKKYPSYSNEALKIVYVNEQLVNGVVTRLDFDTGENNASIFRCHVNLYENPKDHFRKLYIDCFPKAPNLLGGKFEHNASDPNNWKHAKEYLVQEYNSSLKLLDVIRVTTAVSAGLTTETDFYAVSDSDKVIHLCHSSQFDEPWNNVSDLNIECKPTNATPIPTTGGIVEQDPSFPKYKVIALEALAKKYPSYSNEALKIVYVSEQLDNGVITRLDFDTGENNASIFRCHVKLYETSKENVSHSYIDCFPKALNLPGGKFEHNASDPDNWKQVEESLAQKYNSSLQLLDVVRVTTAISNGVTTETDFYAVSNSDKVINTCHSRRFEAPLNNVSELNVECKPKNAKPSSISGEIIEQDPSDPKYEAIALEALAKAYPDYSNESLKIVYVSEQLVNGVITRFDFDTGENYASIFRCHVKLYETLKENIKKVYITCFPKALNILGGKFEQNASDPSNWKYVEASLAEKYNSSLQLLDVVRVTTAISNGVTTETDFYAVSNSDKIINLCHSRRFETPMNNVSELNVECKPKNAKPSPIPGGIVEQDPSDPKYKAAALEALGEKYPSYSNKELKIVYVNEQLDNGVITRLDFDTGENNASIFRCHVKLYETSKENVSNSYIDCFPKALNLPGGKFEHNASDPDNWKQVEESLAQKYNSSLQLLDVVRVTTAVSNGFTTETDFYAISNSDKVINLCHSRRFETPLNNVSELNVECKPKNAKPCPVPGEIVVQDPSDPKYKAVALEALAEKYPSYSNEALKIVCVNEQLDNGVITRLDFDTGENYASIFRCHVKLYETSKKNVSNSYIDCFPKAPNLTGGKFEHNASDPDNWKQVEESLAQKYNSSLQLLDVVRVTTAVSNGFTTETDFYAISNSDKVINLCHSRRFETPLNNVSELNVECKPKNAKPSPFPGGIVEQDPSDPKYKAVALEALAEKYPSYSNEALKIVYVNEQLDNGVITRLDFDTGENNASIVRCHVKLYETSEKKVSNSYIDCFPKAPNLTGGKFEHNASDPDNWKQVEESLAQKYKSSLQLLDVVRVTTAVSNGFTTETDFYAISNSDKVINLCHSRRFETPLNNVSELNVECKPKNAKPSPFPGGIVEQDPSDPKYKAVALEALAEKYPSYSNEALKIVYVNEQLDNGVITRLDFDTGENNASIVRCHVKLYETPRENVRKLYIDCFPQALNLDGGKFEHNASDPDNWKQAEKSLAQKYNSSLQLLDVVRVTTAISNGFTTETDFYAVSDSDEVIHLCHSTELDAPWRNVSELNVECKPKAFNPVTGDIIEKDPKDPELIEIAKMALKTKYPDINYHSLSVVYVNKQFLNGLITRFDFDVIDKSKISDSRCHVKLFRRIIENERNLTVNCFSKETDGRIELNASDPRNWQNAKESLDKELGSSLSLLDVLRVTTRNGQSSINETDFDAISKISNVVYRCHTTIYIKMWEQFKDTELSCEPLLRKPIKYKKGGKIKKDPSDPIFSELANKSLTHFLATTNNNKPYRVAQVLHASEYVTNGFNTELHFIAVLDNHTDILKCFSKIWERSSLNRTAIKVICSSVMPKPRPKRWPGSKKQRDPKNPIYYKLARKSLSQYLDSENVETQYKILVEEVTTQAVSGVSTDIHFTAISVDNSGGHKCHANIWERGWITSLVISVKCNPLQPLGRQKREKLVPGGITERDPKDPKFLTLARKSLRQYFNEDATSNELQLTIKEVNTQVVAGLITRIVFIAKSPSNSDAYKCKSEILERPWENTTTINVNCTPLQPRGRKKREQKLLGGFTQQDPKHPKFLPLARKSLSQYLKEDTSTENLHLTIEEVSTKEVEDIITRLVFIAKSHSYSGGYKCKSEILENLGEESDSINVDCSPLKPLGRTKREQKLLGGFTRQDPKDPKFLPLARKSLSQYLKEDATSNQLQLTIEEVSTQVVAGLITRMVFIAKSSSNADGYKCNSEILERVWENATSINVNCSPLQPLGREKREEQVSGGITQQDPKDPKFLPLARKSLSQYLKGDATSDQLQLTIEEVSTQVVAGLITRMVFKAKSSSNSDGYKCNSEILERAWENILTINVDCTPLQLLGRKKREQNLLGGITQQDPKDPKFLPLAKKSLSQYLKGDATSNQLQLTIEEVSTQVVAGLITRMVFIAKSYSNSDGYKCNSEILERAWENATSINVNCSPLQSLGREKREKQVSGGITQQDPKDPKFLPLARKSLSQYLKGDATSNQLQLTIEEVSTQVVAGLITRMVFVAKSSSNSDGYKCSSEILERAWENSTTINVNCTPLQPLGRKKRQIIVGRKTSQDPNDPKYLSLARNSLSQYLQVEDTGNQFQLSVKRVTTQVVAGISTELDFFAQSLENSDEYKCNAVIWERSWLNSTIIRVNCSPFLTSLDPNDQQVLALAELSLCTYLHIDKISFVNEIKVKKAIVNDGPKKSLILVFQAISKTTFGELKCQSYIWERPVRNYTVVDVHCSPLHNNVRRTSRNAKLNQTKPQDPSDIKYLSLAKESLTHYADLIGSSTQYQISVEQVTTTTVSGVLTQIHFIAAEKLGFNILRCHSEIWEQPWLNSTKFDVICNPFPREERSVSDIVPSKGHYIEKDVRDKRSTDSIKKKNDEINSSELLVDNEDKIEADHLANEALKYINAKYRHPQQMKVKSILSFAKDHYSAHYRIKMEVGFTNCLALSPKAEDCSLVNDMGVHKFCRVSVRLLLDTDQPPRFKVSCDIDENLIEINKNRQAESLFLEFIELYKPTYVNNFKEIRKRLEIFKENIEKIHELNTHERGTARYGVTKFSDLNKEEFSTRYLGLKPHLANPNPMTMTKAEIPNIALPDSIDWRERGAVTEVKNQGACGSCWAFSVTGNIEGQWKLKSGQLVSLSEQELVDCDTADHGCNGGLPDNAYRAIEQLGGLETEQDYPYEATHDSCSFNKTLSKVQISGAVNITSNETAMAMWTAEHGPISIGLNANGMQFYFGGVSHPWKILCNPMNLDHGVLIVGFGVKEYKLFNNTLPYWIIKNSWGPSWGEEGYYRLYRGDGSCGVDQMASSAVIN